MGSDALKIGANTFQYFSRNPRGGSVKQFDRADAEAFMKIARENNFAPRIVHAPYTYNPCSADLKLREFAADSMREDLARLDFFGGEFYNFHPGSHVGQGAEKGVGLIVETLDVILEKSCRSVVLLETMSGKGSEVGASFGEIAEIISRTKLSDKLGVCIDTCHLYSAGFDIVRDLDGVLEQFDKTVGLSRLKAVHLNDTMTGFNSRKDRHAKIGEGLLGLDAVAQVINHPLLRDLPFCLETPNELDGHAMEIALLRSLRK